MRPAASTDGASRKINQWQAFTGPGLWHCLNVITASKPDKAS